MPGIAASDQSRKSGRLSGSFAGAICSIALLCMLYDWPHQVYRKLGPPMQRETFREQFIVSEVGRYASRLDHRLRPTFVIGSVPAAAGAFSGNAVIVISPAMLDPSQFSDNDIRFILAHEVGHIVRLDSYRFWSKWTRRGAEQREADADRIAVRLVGCAAMRETIDRHWDEFMKGYQEEGDHHPHPVTRFQMACPSAVETAKEVS